MTRLMRPIRAVPLSLMAAGLGFMMTSNAHAESAQPGDVAVLDQPTLVANLKALGYQKRGGIDRALTDSTDAQIRALVHFAGSFSAGGKTYPYTMLGYPPGSGKTAAFQVVIIPLRMHFHGFGKSHNVSVVLHR